MSLVQGREDGMETPWQEVEPAVERELLSPKIYFLFFFYICLLFTHMFPSCHLSSQQRQGSRSYFYIRRAGMERLVGTSLIVRHRRGHCGDSVHQVVTSLITRTAMCTRQPLPAAETPEKRTRV